MTGLPQAEQLSNSLTAQHYAAIGWAVLPVGPNKIPLLKEWQKKASNSATTIKEWWTRWPTAGIGVHCGRSGLAVVDIDPRNGGRETLKALERIHGALWDFECLEAKTGGGGIHYVFKAPNASGLPSSLGNGIDVLHGNHYFIVAPTVHPSGKPYEWERCGSPFDRSRGNKSVARWESGLEELPDWVVRFKKSRSPGILAGPIQSGVDLVITDSASVEILIAYPAKETKEEVARLKSAIEAISPDCDRGDYLKVLAGLKWTEWSCSNTLAEAWAATSKQGKYDAKDFRRDWDSLLSARPGRSPVTVASIFKLARESGWDAEKQTSHPTQDARETFGDLSNGVRFATRYQHTFLHCHAAKMWLQWDGLRWIYCAAGEELKAAGLVACEALDAAFASLRKDPSDANRSNHAQALSVHRNVKRHLALLTIAASETGMSIASPAMLDADPWMLGVRNGVVNLKSGSLCPASPSMLISRQAGAAFKPNTHCVRWLSFLNAVFAEDVEMIAFIQRACGYALTGLVDEEVLFFMWGTGANGKSVFANVLHAIFGDYVVTVRATLLARDLKGSGSEAEREKNRLPGARLALINEVASGDVFDDQRVKELVSRERISARALYAESFEFMPSHTIFIRGNHQPGAMDATDGFWRRVILIPFVKIFSESERIPDLDRQILENERDGILAWMVEGCLSWQRDGLRIPPSIKAASEQYRRDTDLMGDWLEARCRPEPRSETPGQELFASYQAFLSQRNIKAPTAPAFGRQLSQRGYAKRRSNGATTYIGLAVRGLFDLDQRDPETF